MHGLNANYYAPSSFIPANLVHTQVDPVVDYQYHAAVPPPFVYTYPPSGGDTCGILWSGWFVPLYTETYTFELDFDDSSNYKWYVPGDGGGRLTINSTLVVNGDPNTGGTAFPPPRTGTIALTAGVPYPISVVYGWFDTDLFCRLKWHSPSQTLEIVPTSALYANSGITANLTATPSTILIGRSTTLAYTTDNATSASLDHGVGTVPAGGGSVVVSPTVTTTYTLTVTGPFGTTTSSVTVIVVSRRNVYIFSTGTLFTDDGREFALLQGVHFVPLQTQRRVLYDCPQVSRFPVDVGLFGGGAVMVATFAGINHDALQEMMSAVESGTNPIVETMADVVQRTRFKAILTTEDTTGAQQVWTLGNVSVPEFEIPTVWNDFTMPKFTMQAYPDGSGNIGTIVIPW